MRMFDMLTRADIDRIKKKDDLGNEDLTKKIEELEGKCREAGRAMIELNLKWESTLVENKKLKEEVEKLKADLARSKEEHQYDNMVHEKEMVVLESLKSK